jgi:hypothetical protein
VSKVWAEAEIVRRRKNEWLVTEMTLLNAAVGAVLSGPKHFQTVVKRLTDG